MIGTGTQPVGALLTAGTNIIITSSAGSITIASIDTGLTGTPIDNYVAVGTGTNLTYVYVGTGQLLIGTGTQPVGALLTAGTNIIITSSAGSITIASIDTGLTGTPIDNYVAVGTGTNLTYVYVGTGQLLIGTGTQPVGALLTAGTNIIITSSAGSITIASIDTGLTGTPIDNYVAVGTGTNLTYVYVGTGQLLIGTGTQPVGALLTAGTNIIITSSAGSITIASIDTGLTGTPIDNYVAVGTGTNLTYVYVGTGQLLIGTGTQPVGAPLTAGANVSITSSAGSITISAADPGLSGTPIDNYVAVGTGTNLTYVYVGTGQLLIGTGTQPVGALLTAGTNIIITSSAGSITIASIDTGLTGTPIDNYVAVGTGTNLTYVYVGTGQLLIGTGTQPVGAPLTAGANVSITSSAGSITISAADPGLSGTPIDNYVAVGTGTNLTYVYVGTGQLLIGTGTQPVGALLTAGTNIIITSSAGSITIASIDTGLTGTPIDNYVAVGTGTNLTYVYVGTGQLLIGTGTQPVGALLTAGTNIIITSSAGSITIASIDTGLTGTPIDNYVAVGTGTNLTYVYVGTGQLLIGTGTQPVGALLTAGTNIIITSSAGSITIASIDTGLTGTPIDNYVAVGTGTNLTYVYVGTGQLLIGTGTQPVGAPLTAGANVSITSSAGSITISAADPGLSGTPIDNYVAVGTGTNLTYVYVGTGQLLIGTGTQPVGALLTAGTNIIITSSAGSITIASIDTGLTGTPIDNYVAVGTGTNLTYVYVGTGQLLIGTGTQPVGALLTAGTNIIITSSAGSITIASIDTGLTGTPIDNYVAVGTGTNLTYVYVGTGQLLIGTGTQPVGALLTAGTNIIITSSAGSITIASIDTGLTGTPIDNYVAVGTGTNLTYVYVGTGQLLIGTGTQPVGAPLTAGANVSITSSAGSITISAADPGLSGTPIDNYVAVGTGTNLTYVYVGTGQLLIGTGTQPVGALLTAGTNIIITSSAGSITIASIDTGLTGTPIDNYVAVGTGTNLTYVYVGTGQLLIGTGTQPVGALLTAGTNIIITSSAGSITIASIDTGLTGTPIDNYVAVGTGTNLTYVYVGTGQLLIGTGTQPVGALLTAGTNIIITSSAGSITIASIDTGLTGTPIDNYVAVGTGTNLTYVYVGTGQLLIGTGTQPVGAPLTAGANVSITSSAGSITISAADPGLSGTPIDNYVAVGTGTNLTYVYVGTGQLLIGTGTQPVGALLTAGTNIIITSSAGSITIASIDTGLTGTPIDNYVAVGTGTNLTYVYVGTGQLLIGTGTQPVGAPLTAGANVSITSSAGSITISAADPGLSGTPIDNYVAVGTGTNLTYVYVGTGQLLIGTGTQPVGAPLTAGANVSITSSAGSITISAADPGLTGTPIDNYVAVGTGTNLTYIYVGTGQLLIGTGTQPVGAPLTAGANVSITSSAGSITISAADPGLSGTPIDNYVAVGTGTNLTYVYVGTGQLLIGTGTQPVGALLTAGTNIIITSSAGSITIASIDTGLTGTPIDNYVAVGTGTNLTYVYVGTGQLLIGTGTQPVGALLTAGTNIIITSSAGSITIASIDTGLTGTPIDNYVAVGTGTNLTYVYVGTGQLLIGTGTQPVGAPLTAGANVSITSSAGSITISAADPGLSGTPIDNYVAVGTGTNLTYVYVGTGQLLIGTGTQPVGALLTAGTNIIITSSAGSITIASIDTGLMGTPIDNYVAVGTGTNLTYVYVGTGQLLIGTGTQPVGALLTAGTNIIITSSAGSITIASIDTGLTGTPIDNYVAVGTGTNLTYVYVGTGQLLIGTGTQPIGAPLTAGANVSITSSAGSITISAADPGLSGTPIDNYVAVGTGTNLTYVYVGTGQLLIGTGTQPVGALLTAGTNIIITSSAGSITIASIDTGLTGTPIDNYVAVGTGTNLTYVYVGTGQLLIGTGTQPVGALLTAGTNIIITSSAGSITIASIDTGLTGTPIDNYVAVGTGTNLTYVYVGTGQLLIGTGTQPVGALLTAGTNIIITSSAGSITIASIDTGLTGTPIDNYVAVGTGTNLTYVYVGTGQLLIGTGTQPVGALLTAGTNIIITSSAGSITIASIDTGLTGTPIDNYVAVGTGTNLTYVYVGTGQLLIGTGTQPLGAPLTAGTGILITSSSGSITIATANSLGGTPIANYVAVGTGTSLTYVYVPTGQLLIGTGTSPLGAPLTAGSNISITSSAGSITITATPSGVPLWSPSVTYADGTLVQYGTSLYISRIGSNLNLVPTGSPLSWTMVGSEYLYQEFATGVLSGGYISLTTTAPSPTVTANAGVGFIQTGTNLIPSQITWSALTGSPPSGIAAGTVLYLYLDANAQLQSQLLVLTPTERRTKILLGAARVATPFPGGTWSSCIDFAQMSADGYDFIDLANAIGAINYSGNAFSYVGTPTGTSYFTKTAGIIFNLNANDRSLFPNNPNYIASSASSFLTFSPIYRGTTGFITQAGTAIPNFAQWNDITTGLATLTNTGWTNNRIYIPANTANAEIAVLHFYGQTRYNSQTAAIDGIASESFVLPSIVSQYILRAFVTHNGGNTPYIVRVAAADKFGQASAGSGGSGGGDVLGPASSIQYAGAFYLDTTGKTLTSPTAALANGQVYIGNGTVPVAANLTAGTNIAITNGVGSITISSTLSGTPIANYVTVGTGTSLTYVYVPTGQLLIGTGTRPLGAPLTAGTGIVITSSAGSITVATANSLGGTPIANYVAVGTGTSITYVYVPTGQLLIGTGTSPIGAPLTAGTGIVITSSAGSITVATANSLGGTPIANYVAVGTGTSLTYVYVPTGQLLIGTGTRPVGASLIAGTNITITSSAGSITIASSGRRRRRQHAELQYSELE